MAVRRLAETQPDSFAFTAENRAWAERQIAKFPEGRQASAVIPLLWRAQEQHDGWLPQKAIEHVAELLGMANIRVLEVATFYTMFNLAPVGKFHVQLCGTTPCMLRGAEDLIKICKKKIASEPFTLNEGGTLSWEEVECQGACVNAPMVMIFKDTFEDLTPERLEEIIDRFEAGKGSEVVPGPQIDRVYSAPIGGLTTLQAPEPVEEKKSVRASKAKDEQAVSVPPSNAAKPSTATDVTNPTLKTPATARKAAAKNVKIEGETVDKSKPAKKPR
jgi:NADH-quinone oxidoreductase subunit E